MAESVVCNVLIDDDNIVEGLDIVVVATEKYFDDNNRFNFFNVVLESVSEGWSDDDDNWELREGIRTVLDTSNGDSEWRVEDTLTSTNIGEECFWLIPSSISLSIKSVVVIDNVEVCILLINKSVVIGNSL